MRQPYQTKASPAIPPVRDDPDSLPDVTSKCKNVATKDSRPLSPKYNKIVAYDRQK